MPIPRKPLAGQKTVVPCASVQTAALTYMIRGSMSISDLSRALGTSWAAAQRLEDTRHGPTLKQLEKAVAACGRRLVLAAE